MNKLFIALIILGIMLLIYISLVMAMLTVFFTIFGLIIRKYWVK